MLKPLFLKVAEIMVFFDLEDEMRVGFIKLNHDEIRLFIHTEVGDSILTLRPGESFNGVTFRQFMVDSSGIMEIPDRRKFRRLVRNHP